MEHWKIANRYNLFLNNIYRNVYRVPNAIGKRKKNSQNNKLFNKNSPLNPFPKYPFNLDGMFPVIPAITEASSKEPTSMPFFVSKSCSTTFPKPADPAPTPTMAVKLATPVTGNKVETSAVPAPRAAPETAAPTAPATISPRAKIEYLYKHI